MRPFNVFIYILIMFLISILMSSLITGATGMVLLRHGSLGTMIGCTVFGAFATAIQPAHRRTEAVARLIIISILSSAPFVITQLIG
jgi:hypothetical protein